MSLTDLTNDFLKLHLATRPVDGSFMGFREHDSVLPPVSDEAQQAETEQLTRLAADVAALPEADTTEGRLERAALHGAVQHSLRENQVRSRFHNPAFYTGEANFGIISILLREEPGEQDRAALRSRIEAIPAFLAAATSNLDGKPAPADWVKRAKLEVAAGSRLLETGLPLHPLGPSVPAAAIAAAVEALEAFGAALVGDDNVDPRAPEGYLEFLFKEVHQFPFSVAEAETIAEEGFNNALAALEKLAGDTPWKDQLAALESLHPELDGILPAYDRLHGHTMAEADRHNLVTPATGYGLQTKLLPEWAHAVAGDLYFLFYRSPAAQTPGDHSIYWVFPPGADLAAYLRGQNFAAIKSTHAVHHGSIGHHTQNARARASKVQLGRVAGTDCAMGISMLIGGTLIEGWACYSQELMLEADGFYTETEKLLQAHSELRNTAMCLADIRLHTGKWTLQQVRDFYETEVGMAGGRTWGETTRNSMFPSTRAMYWLGTRAIRQFRQEIGGDARKFHDDLLSVGSVPVYRIGEELKRAKAER